MSPEEAEAQHQGHDLAYYVAGAPGTGRGCYCATCEVTVWDDTRVMEPWEVR